MTLKLYNTLSRKKEIFRPRKGKKVNLFVCGPTTYDLSHIGHARTYIVFDMIAKYLREKGYEVFYLQNITDVDDKIIDRAIEERVFWQDLSRKFEREYLKDMKALNINSITKYARATAHIKEIINQVKRLLKKDYAYKIKGGIYYDISKFKGYGKLSRRTVLMAEDGVSRIDESKEKRNKGDFCLWKFSKSGEPKWESPWGPGRPGWHIEDTAITEKYFGSQYDIHGGARDLIFPHHEAEIGQMEAISNKKPLVKYWLHVGLLTVKGQKMAKSLRNFITIKDFLQKHSVRILRFFILKTHYRSPIDYSEKEIEQIKKQLERIDEFLEKIQSRAERKRGEAGFAELRSSHAEFRDSGTKREKRDLLSTNALHFARADECEAFSDHSKSKIQNKSKIQISKFKNDFEKAMEDDFNTPKAIAVIFNLVNKGNSLMAKNKLSLIDAREILKFLKKIDKVFNFIFWGKRVGPKIPPFIKKMVREREKARKEKDWKLADEIRRKIKQMGYWVEDTREGPKIKKIT